MLKFFWKSQIFGSSSSNNVIPVWAEEILSESSVPFPKYVSEEEKRTKRENV